MPSSRPLDTLGQAAPGNGRARRTRTASDAPQHKDRSETLLDDGSDPEAQTVLHASCVALEQRGLLILGGSGSGKSSLALDLIALGATLVADDRTKVQRQGASLIASSPPAIAGRIEARHIGLLRLPFCAAAPVYMAIDLDRPEPNRLPPHREMDLLGQTVTLLFRPPGVHAASALLHCLMDRREAP